MPYIYSKHSIAQAVNFSCWEMSVFYQVVAIPFTLTEFFQLEHSCSIATENTVSWKDVGCHQMKGLFFRNYG